MFRIFSLLIGYAFGCFQTAFIVGRLAGQIDIREHGSGNAGMTNVARVMGIKFGLIVFAADVIKAAAAFAVCSIAFGGSVSLLGRVGAAGALPGMYAGLGVIIGHNYPFYLGFKGGKGIASTCGMILALDFRAAAVCFTAALTLIGITRFVSVGSLALTALLPITLVVLGFPPETIALGCAVFLLAAIRHKSNIRRLITGSEDKFSIRKKGTE
ncbi:MAG: glycerol-3-phosphate 1-O-acyltransferase PlsY [Clostridiales bacterium]|jgi:glycerol-3-phosphate acyltransferase PlsY|nr:glycerol-3-phosphate 1-O-acyltransferase PlsY [Clostridiales bacterium]